MADLDDVLEAVVDIEDIAEEVFEPDDLLEDFQVHPLTVLLGLVAAAGVVFTLFMLFLLVVVLAFEFGVLFLVAALAALGFLVTALAVGAFVYVRTDVPHRVQRKIDRTRNQVDGSSGYRRDDGMTEEQAIEHLREEYAQGDIGERELEEQLEAVITSDDPERVVRDRERAR